MSTNTNAHALVKYSKKFEGDFEKNKPSKCWVCDNTKDFSGNAKNKKNKPYLIRAAADSKCSASGFSCHKKDCLDKSIKSFINNMRCTNCITELKKSESIVEFTRTFSGFRAIELYCSYICLQNKTKQGRRDYGTKCESCKIIISGKECKRCSKCKNTIYCSTECQSKDWANHKAYCGIMLNLSDSTIINLGRDSTVSIRDNKEKKEETENGIKEKTENTDID